MERITKSVMQVWGVFVLPGLVTGALMLAHTNLWPPPLDLEGTAEGLVWLAIFGLCYALPTLYLVGIIVQRLRNGIIALRTYKRPANIHAGEPLA
ncbi:hypothetical protein [Novosphingobium sp. 9]|uniref:hypothetical protein n=1 Tax=Novosphingobium sp. 9 TaxID=2025349 RepID=UPI0021B5EF75|nr:hypothetical protein [Novosphingobium sp. 9]